MITPLSKVIDINFKLNETSKTLLANAATGKQFNTADTDAWFEFGFTDANIQSGTYNLTLINLKDESKFEHEGIAFNSNPFYYKLDSGADMQTNEIKHAGTWIGQLVVTLANGKTGTQKFVFDIDNHILDGTVASVTMLEGYNVLMAQIENAKELLDQYNIDYAALLADLEATYNSRLFSVEQQLADTLNKSAITLTHMFADNTARDAYFVANPTELIELQFIKVGTAYQQYIEGVWTDSVPIVSEALSATNQPIVDTGNYFATDKTNDALQELGAHKASTANPHGVTKSQVGLGNVDNTSDANKPVSTAQQTALNAKANKVQEAWITPTLVNGWTSTDFAYMRDEFGFVHFRGILDNPTYNTYFCTLPIDYCPSKTMSLCVISIDTTSNAGTPVQILITQYGTMWLYSTATKPLIMNNISFRVVQ